MRAVKRINNNVVICVSKNGQEFIARGKGIGFHEFPYELELSKVERTYYNINPTYVAMIHEIPDEVFEISGIIVDKAITEMDNIFGSNIVFTLADHLNFTIERYRKNINIKLPIVYDVEHLFEKEYNIGKFGLTLIKKKLNIWMPEEEAAYIALHIINAEEQVKSTDALNDKSIEDITSVIEKEYDLKIDRQDFNYSRFVTHMHYLLKRREKGSIRSKNDELFRDTIEKYPDTYECAKKISDYIQRNLHFELSNEEQLYLMLHVNRLTSREECNQ